MGPQAAGGELRDRLSRQRPQRIRRQGCGPRMCQVLPRAHGRVRQDGGAGPVVLRSRRRDADRDHRGSRDPPPRDQAPGEGPREQHLRRHLPEARRRFGRVAALQRPAPGDLPLERSRPRGGPSGGQAGLRPVPRNPDACPSHVARSLRHQRRRVQGRRRRQRGHRVRRGPLDGRRRRTSHSPGQGGAGLGPGGLCGEERLPEPRTACRERPSGSCSRPATSSSAGPRAG